MTRSNLNFISQNAGEAPRLLFHYHNGGQYPEGLLQFFGIEEFLTIDRLWTPEDFQTWIRQNYRKACRKISTLPNGMMISAHADTDEPAEAEDLGEDGQPRIFYTGTFITDFSYVFTHSFKPGRKRSDGTRTSTQCNWVYVWNYNELVFDGPASQFLRFCRKRAEPKILPPDAAAFSAVSEALGSVQS